MNVGAEGDKYPQQPTRKVPYTKAFHNLTENRLLRYSLYYDLRKYSSLAQWVIVIRSTWPRTLRLFS